MKKARLNLLSLYVSLGAIFVIWFAILAKIAKIASIVFFLISRYNSSVFFTKNQLFKAKEFFGAVD